MNVPITMAEAGEMGVPECFSLEYAFHERNGSLPPYGGPVTPDHNREDIDDDPMDYSSPAVEPKRCQGPARTFEFLDYPYPWRAHDPGCWDLHPAYEQCPPPF